MSKDTKTADDRFVPFIWDKIRMCPIKAQSGTIKSLKQMNWRILRIPVLSSVVTCNVCEKLLPFRVELDTHMINKHNSNQSKPILRMTHYRHLTSSIVLVNEHQMSIDKQFMP